MTLDLRCGKSSSQCFCPFKTLNPSELSNYIALTFQGNQFYLVVEYEFTSEGNVKETQRFTVRYHTFLFYLMYPPPRKQL